MDDARVWAFEESLWTADADRYREAIDDACVMVVPAPPYVLTGPQSVDAVAATPRWEQVRFEACRVSRPQEGLIVIGYHVEAVRAEGDPYRAHCTSTYRRIGPEAWKVVQHQQTPELVAGARTA